MLEKTGNGYLWATEEALESFVLTLSSFMTLQGMTVLALKVKETILFAYANTLRMKSRNKWKEIE